MTNYKHQYEQMKLMVDKYQNEIVPGLRKLIAEREPVRHGRWVDGVPYICSKCGKPAPEEENNSEYYKCWLSPYCPHCGAKMDGDDHDKA